MAPTDDPCAESEADARGVLPQVQVRAEGGRVSADGPSNPARGGERWREGGRSVSYRIWAPRNTALELTARNGGVSVRGMRGTSHVETANGGLTLDDVGGRVEGRTVERRGEADVALSAGPAASVSA